MPLEKGADQDTIERNIREMMKSGYPHNQAVAAALHTAHPKKPEPDADERKGPSDADADDKKPGGIRGLISRKS